MSSASLFEQLTSSVSLSVVTIVSVVILALILLYTIACRLFFSSSKKSKSNSSSKQVSNKDKKPKETNTKKQQQQQQTETTVSNKKKNNNNKTKKNANATPPPPVKPAVSSSSSSSDSQSEESEDEKVALVAPAKKPTASNKVATVKKVAANDESNKPAVSTNGIKTSTKQQQQAPGRNENVDGTQSVDGKKKQLKANATPALTKQQSTGKSDAANKVNTKNSNKKQPVVSNSEVKSAPVDVEGGSDQEDEGQWVTQSSKQVNNRNRNKGKNETSNTNNQELSPSSSSNRKTTSEKRTAPTTTSTNTSSSTNTNEGDIESTVTSNVPVSPSPQIAEPIEICELLPTSENRYTASDDWWKQALNKQQTFSVDDIGEWPEREQDEQYVINVKRIIPVKTTKALSEKDINVEGNDEINNYKNGKEDEKLNFDEQTNSSSVVTGEPTTTTTTTTSKSKKKSTNVRRLS